MHKIALAHAQVLRRAADKKKTNHKISGSRKKLGEESGGVPVFQEREPVTCPAALARFKVIKVV